MDEPSEPLPEKKKRGAPYGNTRGLGNRGGGRATKYRPTMVGIARRGCECGMTDLEIANLFGCGESTLRRWKATHSGFSSAFKLGRATAAVRVERSLYSRAVGYTYTEEKAVTTRHGPQTVRHTVHVPP